MKTFSPDEARHALVSRSSIPRPGRFRGGVLAFASVALLTATLSAGNASAGVCAEGLPCDDANACTTDDTCTASVCAGVAVVCSPLDQCHDTGSCDVGTGLCSNPEKTNGAICNDDDACTNTDTCQAGLCTAGEVVVCTPQDECHLAGICDSGTGCSNPEQVDGVVCEDGNACTATSSCQVGVCAGADPVVCGQSDQCHDVGTCDVGTGICSNPEKVDGSACNDSNACTVTDTCQVGVCTGADPVTCTPQDQCHDAGTCDVGTGLCSNPVTVDGAACNDGNPCTVTDTCLIGVCTAGEPVVCTPQDQCHNAGLCDIDTGCPNPPKPDGATCDDGNACTQSDTCQAGDCTGADPIVCPAGNLCEDVGTCDAGTGVCSTPTPVTCSPLDQCHVAGTCDIGTGACSNPAAPNGVACDDGEVCTTTDICQAGACVAGAPLVCADDDLCTTDPVCESGVGCVGTPAPQPSASCLLANKNLLLVSDSNRSKLSWKWTGGEAFDQASLGAPLVDTTYALCVYDTSASVVSLAVSAMIEPSAIRWSSKAPKGLHYKNPTGSSGGVTMADLRTGVAGRTKVKVVASGTGLVLPGPVGAAYFNQDPDVFVQFVNSQGTCWTSEFVDADTKKNTDKVFKAITK